MLHKEWESRWNENRIGFHRGEVNPLLMKFGDCITDPSHRILVPLCGKTLDMLWLSKRCHTVIGSELIEKAVVDFFQENQLEYTVSEAMPLHCYRSEIATLYQGDFFQLTPNHLGTIHVAYDRASIVALPQNLRAPYANHLVSLVQPGGTILLITFYYDQSLMSGPPYSVTPEEIQSLFQELCNVEPLFEQDVIESESARFRQKGLTWLKEAVFRLTVR